MGSNPRAPSGFGALLLPFLATLFPHLQSHLALAEESDRYFCGTSWSDASENCVDRQHCPTGTDDECSEEGHVCFGGTTCDASLGHGAKAAIANVPYEDFSNTRFCGKDWSKAIEGCSVETHCPSGYSDDCPPGLSCFGGLGCNVQDLIEASLLSIDATAGGEGSAAGGESGGSIKVGKDDPARSNFCGTSWGDANSACGEWCPGGEDTDCPPGLGCFGNTGCYYDDDLVPTSSPVEEPTVGPTTVPPVLYKDPANVRYCGLTWALAVSGCSVETHCPSGLNEDCPKGQSCHGGIMQCNIFHLSMAGYFKVLDLILQAERANTPSRDPTPAPISGDDPKNNKFCGASWTTATENCSLRTHCPNDVCPDGLRCYEMTGSPTVEPTDAPTDSPTYRPTAPTASPTLNPTTETRAPQTSPPTVSFLPTPAPTIPADDPRHSYWCGKDWSDVTKNCHQPCISGQDTECPGDMSCIAFTSCRPKPKPTAPPTREPTTETPTQPPSPPPTPMPAVAAQTNSPITESPTGRPIETFTMRPTSPLVSPPPTPLPTPVPTPLPTPNPTEYYQVDVGDAIEVVHTTESNPAPVTLEPSGKPSAKSSLLTKKPTSPPQTALPPSTAGIAAPSNKLIATVGSILVKAENDLSTTVLLSIDTTTNEATPTKLYQYRGFINALGVISKGDMGSSFFYLGNEDEDGGMALQYALANLAIFLAEATVETVQYDVCDDVNWERDVFNRYPIANSCGQGRFVGDSTALYEDSNPCAESDAFMACQIVPGMQTAAETHGVFVGAPPPLECFPKTQSPLTGAWDPSLSCVKDGCSTYDGQTMGNIGTSSIPTANSFGRDNVEGCCWWGSYYLGKRALDEGRSSARYKDTDFCDDPGAICRGSSEADAEVRWIMGMLFWIKKVQTYDSDGWSYLERLRSFVNGGMSDMDFLESVSRIVARGCHVKSKCGNAVMSSERRAKFETIIYYFGRAQVGAPEKGETNPPMREPTQSPSKRQTLAPSSRPTISRLTFPPPPSYMALNRPNPATYRPTLRPSEAEEINAPMPPKPQIDISNEIQAGVPGGEYKLTASELANRLNFPNNYCARSREEAESNCSTSLRTCNFGNPPCEMGLDCYGDIVCSIAWTDIKFESPQESSHDIESYPSSEISCVGVCLRPLGRNECAAGGNTLVSLPSCNHVEIGDMCERNDCRAADDAIISNCRGRGIFMRVLLDQCIPLMPDSPSTNNENIGSSSPSSSAFPSPNPSPSDEDFNDSIPKDDSAGYEEFSGLPPKDDDSSPGAWWKRHDINCSIRLRTFLVLPLQIVTVTVLLPLNG
ncbi:hypothetical protein ACHAWF_016718 [Thalassiosira exigua]